MDTPGRSIEGKKKSTGSLDTVVHANGGARPMSHDEPEWSPHSPAESPPPEAYRWREDALRDAIKFKELWRENHNVRGNERGKERDNGRDRDRAESLRRTTPAPSPPLPIDSSVL